jgi:hypothetical protein
LNFIAIPNGVIFVRLHEIVIEEGSIAAAFINVDDAFLIQLEQQMFARNAHFFGFIGAKINIRVDLMFGIHPANDHLTIHIEDQPIFFLHNPQRYFPGTGHSAINGLNFLGSGLPFLLVKVKITGIAGHRT